MISHEHKCIFIHIPKCAGTSIEKHLGFVGKGNYDAHKQLQQYNSENNYESYFKFSFVRNPWDKLVSEYFWFTNSTYKYPRPGIKLFYRKHAPTFKHFVPLFLNGNLGQKQHRMHYFYFLHPINELDFIGKFENLQEDFTQICDKLEIKDSTLPHKFKTDHKPYWEYYDDETREMVEKHYEVDINYFNYKFGE